MNSYIIAPEAMSDLEQIIDYLAMDNVNKGENFLNEFNKKCRYLTQFPMMGRSYREIRSYLRSLPMKKHIIFYRVLNDGLEIMRVVPANRDLEAIFSDY
jgi:toxin ParE1/3/4